MQDQEGQNNNTKIGIKRGNSYKKKRMKSLDEDEKQIHEKSTWKLN